MTGRAPAVVSALAGAGGLAWAVAIGVDPGPLAPSAAAAVAIGFVLAASISTASIMLARAPLGRWLALGTCIAGVAGLAVFPPNGWSWLATSLSAAAITGLVGPWLRVWVRGRPKADSIGWQPPALLLAGLALTPLVGLAAPDGLHTAHGVLAGVGLALTWAYSRARLWGLWGMRLVVVPAAAWAAAVTPRLAGAAAIAAAGAAVAALAWTKAARRAIGIPAPVLPAPMRRRPQRGSS